MFSIKQQPGFEKAKELIEHYRQALITPTTHRNELDDLEKLAELKNKGIITEDEFQSKKRKY